jgi:osmotically-inducible protein OsmY
VAPELQSEGERATPTERIERGTGAAEGEEPTMKQPSLTERIERELEQRVGVYATVEESEGVITLSGRVDVDEAREAAARIAARLAPNHRVDNDLEVETILPDPDAAGLATAEAAVHDIPNETDARDDAGDEIEPDFTDQPLLTDPIAAAGPGSGYEDPIQSGDDVYVPPTDPVVTGNERGELAVLGGFSPDSMDEVAVAPSASDNRLGDEAIEDAIRRELREDAATTDFEIDVLVRQGVARLRGRVADVDDVENAESVAARVPGVREVVEELDVGSQ